MPDILLAIETSFDDTAIAAIDAATGATLWAATSSSAELNQVWGGVVPELAARSHLENLPKLWRVFADRFNASDIRAVGVTSGPGLPGCLLAGVSFARGLALALGVPIYCLNHLEGHLLSPWQDGIRFERDQTTQVKLQIPPEYPVLGLIKSGGHTDLVLIEWAQSIKLIGETSDDAVGELLDKLGKRIGLGYPAGPLIEKWADFAEVLIKNNVALPVYKLPVPMLHREEIEFSYSGLKTAAVRLIDSEKIHTDSLTPPDNIGEITTADKKVAAFCLTLQRVVASSLVEQIGKAVKQTGVCEIGISGGVACNMWLRAELRRRLPNLAFIEPARRLCIDNAEMMAYRMWLGIQAGDIPVDRDIRTSWQPEC